MIGVGGLARAGKDTLSRCLKKVIENDFDCEVEIVHLADKLKSDLENLKLVIFSPFCVMV